MSTSRITDRTYDWASGGLLGLGLGVVGIRALLAVNTAGLPRIGEEGALVAVDWRVMTRLGGTRIGPRRCPRVHRRLHL